MCKVAYAPGQFGINCSDRRCNPLAWRRNPPKNKVFVVLRIQTLSRFLKAFPTARKYSVTFLRWISKTKFVVEVSYSLPNIRGRFTKRYTLDSDYASVVHAV